MDNLSYLQRLTMFAGLFFASMPGLVDGGGELGGGDDGGGGSEVVTDDGGAGDEGSDGGTEGDGETGDEGLSEESEQTAEETEGEEEGGEEKGAAKPLSDRDLEKGLNDLRKTNPKLAAKLRSEHFQNRDYRRAGTPTEVMEMRETLESVGGPEGLAEISDKADTFAAELTQIAQGDTAIIDTLAQDFPQSLPKLAPHSMEKLRQVNPEAYERSVSGMTANFLRDKGVTGSLQRLADIIRMGSGVEGQKAALELANKLVEWTSKTEEFGRSRPTEQGPSEEQKRLQTEREEINREKSTMRTREIGNAITATMSDIIGRNLAPYLQGRKLTTDQKQLLSKTIFDKISGSLQGNERYQVRFKALMKRGNVAEIRRFVGAKVAEIAEKSVRSAWNASGHAAIKRKAAAEGGAQGKPQVVRASKIPAPHTIDWDKDPGRNRFLRGEVTLKKEYGGKIVRFDPNSLA